MASTAAQEYKVKGVDHMVMYTSSRAKTKAECCLWKG